MKKKLYVQSDAAEFLKDFVILLEKKLYEENSQHKKLIEEAFKDIYYVILEKDNTESYKLLMLTVYIIDENQDIKQLIKGQVFAEHYSSVALPRYAFVEVSHPATGLKT